MKAVTSRPCMYGTFSGLVGGFAPRPQHYVGYLRCNTQNPDIVQILLNPEREKLGDSYFHFRHINAAAYESETAASPSKELVIAEILVDRDGTACGQICQRSSGLHVMGFTGGSI